MICTPTAILYPDENENIIVFLPVLDRRPRQFLRDPALYFTGGELLCFHTTVEETLSGQRLLFIELSRSRDFQQRDTRRLSDSPLNFSSPGNLMEVNGEYVLCLQSYPIPEGQLWADEHCRLYLMRSQRHFGGNGT